jgi:predicted PurR-regulated permease PerM
MGNREQQMRRAKWLIGIIAVCIVIYAGVQNIGTVGKVVGGLFNLIFPLILGLILALILNVPLRPLEKHFFPRSNQAWVKKIRRPCCILIALLIILSVLTGVLLLVVPELVSAIGVLGESVVDVINSAQDWSLQHDLAETPVGSFLMKLELNWNAIQSSLFEWAKGGVADILGTTASVIGTLAGRVINFTVALVFAIYILSGKERLKGQAVRLIHAWVPEKFSETVLHVGAVFGDAFRKFVAGQTIEAIILGSLCFLGMWIFRFPYAPMIGALVGVTALVPMLGGLIGGFVGALMILPESFTKAILFVVFLVILQQLEDNLIYPRVVGSSMGLPAIWVLAAITVGGSMGGVVGMLFSVPVASALYRLLREATEWKESKLTADRLH